MAFIVTDKEAFWRAPDSDEIVGREKREKRDKAVIEPNTPKRALRLEGIRVPVLKGYL